MPARPSEPAHDVGYALPLLTQEAYMPIMCFSYEADAPRKMPAGPCFSYPAMCFGYPADVPPGNRDAAQPAVPGLRSMPFTCFRY
jgi:hypothetical protein